MDQAEKNEALVLEVSAADDEDIQEIKKLLEMGANPEAIDHYNWSSLMYAATYNNINIARLLLEYKADINKKSTAKGAEGRTALAQAIYNRSDDVIDLLLNNGADVNVKDDEDLSPLYFAIKNKDIKTVNELIARGADVNTVLKGGDTALLYAAQEGLIEIVKTLMASDADIHAKNEHGYTPLFYACKQSNKEVSPKDYTEIVALCIRAGAEVQLTSKYSETTTGFARLNKNEAIKKLLLEAGAEEYY